MENLISLLIAVLVLGMVFAIIYWAIGQMALPAPFRQVAIGVMALIVVIFLLGLLFGGIRLPVFRF